MPNLLQPTGSLVNNIHANARQPTPQEGMGATALHYTDRAPYTIIRVVSPTCIVVREDKATRRDKNGMSESQEYDYSPDEDGKTHTVTLRKNGRWVRRGGGYKNGLSFRIGVREKYHDFSF